MGAGVHPAAAPLVPAEEGEGGSSTPRLSARPSLGSTCSCRVSEQPQAGHSRKAEEKEGEADKLGTHRHVPEPWSPRGTHPPTGTQQLLKHYTWEEGALAHTHTHTLICLLSSFKNKKNKKFSLGLQKHTQAHARTPHLHPEQLLELFSTGAFLLRDELQPLPEQLPLRSVLSPTQALSLCFLSRSLAHQPEKSLSACSCLSSLQASYFQVFKCSAVAQPGKVHGSRGGSKMGTEQPQQ